jgi:hypothetical protein
VNGLFQVNLKEASLRLVGANNTSPERKEED